MRTTFVHILDTYDFITYTCTCITFPENRCHSFEAMIL